MPDALLQELSAQEVSDLSDMWALCGSVAPVVAENGKDAVRATVLNEITKPATIHTLRPASRSMRVMDFRMRVVSIAAALVVGLSVVLTPTSDTYRAPSGIAATAVELADGSVVTLAPGSRMSVQDDFNADTRTVRLHGTAFFDVNPSDTPFVIKTADATTTVLGTSFEVSSWPGQDHVTQVTVNTGSVSVVSNDVDVVLAPGDRIDANVGEILSVDAASNIAWIDGGFSYQNELIGTVIADVERRFDVRIKAPASIRLRPITIHRNEVEDAGEFLGDIAATISVRYRPTANGYEMYLN